MLGIVVPAYNCDSTLPDLCRELLDAGLGRVFVVDDFSNPPVGELIRESEFLTIIRNQGNKGYSLTVLRGMQEAILAGCAAVATIDGDAAHRVSDLGSLWGVWQRANTDLLIGDRMSSLEFYHLPTKRLANLISSELVTKCFGGELTSGRDVSSGLRVYSCRLARALLETASERFGLCYSSIYFAKLNNYHIDWHPIEVIYPSDQVHFTKQREFLDLLIQLSNLNLGEYNLTDLTSLVSGCSSFNVKMTDFIVFALYVDFLGGYLFRVRPSLESAYHCVNLVGGL